MSYVLHKFVWLHYQSTNKTAASLLGLVSFEVFCDSEVAGLGDQPLGDQSSSNWEGGKGNFLSEKGETGDSLPCFADKLAQR